MKNVTLTDEICKQRPSLQQYAMKFTNDVEDANDLVQDTLIKAIRYLSLYKQGTNLRGWLYTIMRNTFINDYRRQTRRSAVIDTTEELNAAQLMPSASGNLGENKFMLEDINKALAQLEPCYSAPFLRYFEGYKYHEIAEEMQIPIGTVKTRIHVARQVLKGQLKMYRDQLKSAS